MSEDTLQKIVNKLSAMESKYDKEFANLNKKVDGITAQVVTNAEHISAIKDNQKTLSNVINKIASVQERQEQTIDLLARRSLDQEAELKRIK